MSFVPRSSYRQSYASSGIRSYHRTRVTPMKWKFVFGPMTLIIGLILAAMALSLLYLAHFNQVATKGYDLKRLEVARQHLLDEHQVGNMRLASATSMATLLKSDRIQRMVNARNITFVRGDTAIASR